MFKVTTKDNPEYQEFKSWSTFHKTNQVLHSHNDKPSVIGYYDSGEVCYKWWYLDGQAYCKQDYKRILKQVKSMSDTEKLLDSRWWVREQVK